MIPPYRFQDASLIIPSQAFSFRGISLFFRLRRRAMNGYVYFQTVKTVAARHYRVLPCSQFAGTRLRPRKLLDGIAQKTRNTPETACVSLRNGHEPLLSFAGGSGHVHHTVVESDAVAMPLNMTLLMPFSATEEGLIRRPVSPGCIRMLNRDVMALFDMVRVETAVSIIQ